MKSVSTATVLAGTAGPRGPEVRADCFVSLALRREGGRDIQVKSKVASMYGGAIRDLVEEGLEALGLPHARVEIEDAGALPFVLAARLEAAARRALPDLDRSFLPEAIAAAPAASDVAPQRDRLRRSRLYLPGNNPRFMPNAFLHGADGLILDLEDSVAPAVKDEAKILVRNALRALEFGGAERMVRVNQLPRGLDDLEFVVPHHAQLILLPKCEDPGQVVEASHRVQFLARKAGLAHPPLLMPILESARGVLHAEAIAAASDGVAALTIGLEDYTADIGAVKSASGEESFWARSVVVAAARAAEAQPIDSVFGDVEDVEGLRAWGRRSRAMGFVGMGCIHPRQIAVVHDAFAPSAEELERALRIVRAFDEAQADGRGVVALGSKMVDAPVVKRAQDLVRAARAMGRLE